MGSSGRHVDGFLNSTLQPSGINSCNKGLHQRQPHRTNTPGLTPSHTSTFAIDGGSNLHHRVKVDLSKSSRGQELGQGMRITRQRSKETDFNPHVSSGGGASSERNSGKTRNEKYVNPRWKNREMDDDDDYSEGDDDDRGRGEGEEEQ